MSKEKSLKGNRLLELDGLRGIAAVIVMMYHYSLLNPDNVLFTYFQFGKYGVHMFFVISGFVIFMTLQKTERLWDFVISRFSRLFPTYWFAIIITTLIINTQRAAEYKITIIQFLVNLSMLQHWVFIKDIDGVYWTLTIELCFYIFMVCVFLSKMIQKIDLLGLIFLGLMVAVKIVRSHFDIPFYFLVPLLSWGNLFFAGIIFYKIKFRGSKYYYHLTIFLSLVVHFFIHGIQEGVVVFIVFSIFYLFVFDYLKFLRNNFLIYLGAISYSLYLLHEVNGQIFYKYLGQISDSDYIKIPLIIVVALTMSTFSTYLIEKPTIKFIRALYQKKLENV